MTRVSFEFFPPTSPLGTQQLQKAVTTLSRFNPSFVSMTYGAGGSNADRSIAALGTLAAKIKVQVLGHITMVDQDAQAIDSALEAYDHLGADGYVALRGDAKAGQPGDTAFLHVPAFVEHLKARRDAPVYVAAYPLAHPKAVSEHADIYALRQKFEAGADVAISQFFFEADEFLRFRDKCAAAGITKPIIPGVLPFTSPEQVGRLSKLSGLDLPAWLISGLRNAQSHGVSDQFALAVASEMVETLIGEGVEDIHFYALNSAKVVSDVCSLFDLGAREIGATDIRNTG